MITEGKKRGGSIFIAAIIVAGLLAIGLSSLASALLVYIGTITGCVNIEKINSNSTFLHMFMIFDILINAVIYFFAGYFAAKFSTRRELQAGCFLSAFSVIFFVLFGGGFDVLPLYYNLLALLSITSLPVLGALYYKKKLMPSNLDDKYGNANRIGPR